MYTYIQERIKDIQREIKRLGRDGWGIDDLRYLMDEHKTTQANFYFDIWVIFLILVSCGIYVALTYLSGAWYTVLFTLEIILMVFFTAEYLLRIYFEKKPQDYLFSWYGVFDFLAVVPFWLAFVISGFGSLLFLRILRVFKLYRFFNKYLDKPIVKKETASRIMVTKMIFTLGAILFISSGLIYTFESGSNPNIVTFDDALYFSLVTVTTVGFGDITPVSQYGRMVVMAMVLVSIFLVPVYIASLLRSYMTHTGKRTVTCTTCGLKYHDHNAVHCKMCGAVIFQEYEDD